MSRDDDLARPAGSGEMGPLDKLFRDTNIVILVIFSICCSGIALILAVICLATAKDAKAKSNATLVAIIGGIIVALNMIGYFTGALGGIAGGGR